jgi:glucokinase
MMKKLSLGIDIGGTKLAVALVDEFGKVKNIKTVHDHIGRSDDDLIDYINELSNKILTEEKLSINDISGLGLCFPGHIRYKEGITVLASNFSNFKHYPLKAKLEGKLGINVVVDNDANCQAYADHKFGAGKGFDDMVFITVSTGIGGGIIINNKLYRGMTGSAGEFGHMIIDYTGGHKCTCNNRGCWNISSAGVNLKLTAEKYLKKGIKSSIVANKDDIDGTKLSQGWRDKDPLCTAIVEEYVQYIAIGLSNVFQILNPPIIVLGGGLMKIGDGFLNKIREKFKELAGSMLVEEMLIELTNLNGNAAVIGAAAIAMDEE